MFQLDLSHEAVYSEQNADFVAVKHSTVPCVGCPFDLNLDIKGVGTLADIALRHVEREHDEKHALVRVIRLQQQVNKTWRDKFAVTEIVAWCF